MASTTPLCFFTKPLSWIAPLVLPLIFACFFGFGCLSSLLLTSIALIISTLFFTFTKQKPYELLQELAAEECLDSDQGTSSTKLPENEATKLEKEEQEEEEEEEEAEQRQIHDYSIKSSPDLLSESESLNHLSSSEESEVDWPFRPIVYQSPDCSDGSISDEESDLIEISLPSGHYVGHCREEVVPNNKFKLQQSMLKQQQHSLMELLAEINDMSIEEDNLIEIDISMGSIKCSRFEIEA